ncbi:MAG: hypothetical protein LBD41_01330, partial [Clostridiales Family XIII bacterium]|nr:hypothetical protein [Clostridiales Family XIII bacterium]
ENFNPIGTALTNDYQAIGNAEQEEKKTFSEADRVDEQLHQNVHIDAVEYSSEVLDADAIKEEKESEVEKKDDEGDSYL